MVETPKIQPEETMTWKSFWPNMTESITAANRISQQSDKLLPFVFAVSTHTAIFMY